MQYRTYGKTGIRVSALGFGAMRLPTLADKTVDLEASIPLLRRGIDLGINFIDSAFYYIEGTSEIAVGQAIKPYPREQLYLSTKIPAHDWQDGTAAVWRSRLETQLKRLDTPYIDFMLFHGLEWAEFDQVIKKPGMALEAARKAQSEGLVRHLCFSSHDEPQNIIQLVDTLEFEGMLVQYNYLDRHNEPAIQRASERGMGVVIMGPVAGGRLVTPQPMQAGDAARVSTPELALRFVWNNPYTTVALSGMNSLAQIEENCHAASLAGTLDDA
ncbi:MAG TPA: aldo/keto reductase, partial [Anaerolineales bacterium]